MARVVAIVCMLGLACSRTSPSGDSIVSAPPPPGPVAPAPPVAAPRVVKVYGGPESQCLVREDGAVECWGMGNTGSREADRKHKIVVPTVVAGVANATAVALAQGSVCALIRDGSVWCWGDNSDGQLGDGTRTPRATPAQVPALANVVEIGAGDSGFCARLADKTVRCWGDNEEGTVGDGTNIARASPVKVAGIADAEQLAFGGRHVCVRRTAGTISCWGGNDMAELAKPRSALRSSRRPIAVAKLADVVDIAAGQNHTCARLATGTVACWGWDEECQLGFRSTERCLGASPCMSTPTEVPGLTDVVELAPSSTHSCARHSDGTVSCWGDDPRAFKPDNTTDVSVPRLCAPTKMPDVSHVAQLSVFWGGVCTLRDDNTIWCWGPNWFGELGDGTTRAHVVPAQVKR